MPTNQKQTPPTIPQIHVYRNHLSHAVVRSIPFIAFWGALVGSVAVNTIFLGGSSLISFIAFMFTILGFGVMMQNTVAQVEERKAILTIDEAAAWLAAGAPSKVNAWLAGYRRFKKAEKLPTIEILPPTKGRR